MPDEVAQIQHAHFGHPNRKRLYRVLRSLGILKYWVLPSEIPCNSSDVAKAKQQPHCGTLKPAQYPNEITHADVMNMSVPDVHGNLHSLTIVDGKSRLKTVYPMVRHDLGIYGKKGFERESTRIGDFIPAGPLPLFPQGLPFIPAGLSLYSRRAFPLFPQG